MVSKKVPAIILAVMIAIGIGIFFAWIENYSVGATYTNNYDNTPSYQPTVSQQQNCRYVDIPHDELEYYSEKEPYTDQECVQETFSYAIEHFKQEYTKRNCNVFGLNCDHYVECSLEVVNHERDHGLFRIQPKIMKNGRDLMNSENGIGVSVYALSQKRYSWHHLIGKDETATCIYTMKRVPQKTTCQTVTKYKTIQKSRTVTKWKQEYQCS